MKFFNVLLICFYAIRVCKQVRNKTSLKLFYGLHVARVKKHKGTNVFYCKTFLLKWINFFFIYQAPTVSFLRLVSKFLPSKLVIVCKRSLLIRLQKCISTNLIFKHVFETQCTVHCINIVLICVFGRIIDLDNHNLSHYSVVLILGEYTISIYLPEYFNSPHHKLGFSFCCTSCYYYLGIGFFKYDNWSVASLEAIQKLLKKHTRRKVKQH